MKWFSAEIVTTQSTNLHKIGSLLPLQDDQHKCLQMYFIGESNDELNARCGIHTDIKRSLVSPKQQLVHEKNNLVRLFETAINMCHVCRHLTHMTHTRLVIHAIKAPAGEKARRFNFLAVDEIAVVIFGDQFQSSDIIFHEMTKFAETHRCYHALQYPIIF